MRQECAANFAKKQSLLKLSVLPDNPTRTNPTGHVWNVNIQHVHPAAAMRSQISRKLKVDGCAKLVRVTKQQCTAKCARKRSLLKLSVLPQKNNGGNPNGHVWNVSIQHVHPAAAMRSLTDRKLVVDGSATLVGTHRALAVARQGLNGLMAKRIQRK